MQPDVFPRASMDGLSGQHPLRAHGPAPGGAAAPWPPAPSVAPRECRPGPAAQIAAASGPRQLAQAAEVEKMAQQMRAPVQPMQAAVLAGQPLCFRVAPAQRRQAAGQKCCGSTGSRHPVALAGMLRQFGFRQIAQRQGRAQRLNVAPCVLAVHQIEQGRCRVEGLAVAEHGQIAWCAARQGQQVARRCISAALVSVSADTRWTGRCRPAVASDAVAREA